MRRGDGKRALESPARPNLLRFERLRGRQGYAGSELPTPLPPGGPPPRLIPDPPDPPLGRLKTDEVADVVQITKARVLKALERRGVVRVSPEALEVDDAFAARDPVLAQLAVAAVAGLPAPAGGETIDHPS